MVPNLIKQVVDIQIRNVTSNTLSRDLNTIMILASHDEFTAPEIYREYTDSLSVLEDGFETSSYVYNAVNTIFSQDITPVSVLVGRVPTTGGDYMVELEKLLAIPTGWLWLISDLRVVTEQKEIAQFLESNEKFYLAATHDPNALLAGNTTDLASVLAPLELNNTAAWFDDARTIDVGGTPTQVANFSEAALVGRCANGIAGTVNFRLKILRNVGVAASVDTQTKISTLTNKGYNFAATIQGDTRSFGSGKVVSGEWIHIRLGITWLEVNIREEVFYTIADTEKLPYENEGAAAIESRIRSVITRGQNAGIVAKDTPVNITVPNVLDLPASQRATGILPNVVFTCRMSGAIQGTVIRGSVYL